MSIDEVDEMLTMFVQHYPEMQLDAGERNSWRGALNDTDADLAMEAAGFWMASRIDIPMPQDINAAVRRRQILPRLRQQAFDAYEAECSRLGKPMTSKAFQSEIASLKVPPAPRMPG